MIKLYRVTGQMLELEFGGTGGLSKAVLDGKLVTAQAACMKEFDYKEFTSTFGFDEKQPPADTRLLFGGLSAKLKTAGFFIQKISNNADGSINVWLCREDGDNHVIARTAMVAQYDPYKKMFFRISQCLDPRDNYSVANLNSVI